MRSAAILLRQSDLFQPIIPAACNSASSKSTLTLARTALKEEKGHKETGVKKERERKCYPRILSEELMMVIRLTILLNTLTQKKYFEKNCVLRGASQKLYYIQYTKIKKSCNCASAQLTFSKKKSKKIVPTRTHERGVIPSAAMHKQVRFLHSVDIAGITKITRILPLLLLGLLLSRKKKSPKIDHVRFLYKPFERSRNGNPPRNIIIQV